MYKRIFQGIVLTIITISSHSLADEDTSRFAFNGGANILYDSNVNLSGVDASTGEADTASKFDAGISATFKPHARTSLTFAYDYSATSYERFSEFDLVLHHAGAAFSYTGFGMDAGLSADKYFALLDGEDYLDITQFAPSISRLFGSRFYVRAGYTASTKQYDALPQRNADSGAWRVDNYLLLDGMNRYLALGLQTTTEDAVDPELDYESVTAMLTYGQRTDIGFMPLQLKAQLRMERRDYNNVNADIGAPREDDRLRSTVSAEIPFSDHISLQGRVEHYDNDSNLATAMLDKFVYQLGLTASF